MKSRNKAGHSLVDLMELVGHHGALPLGWQQRLVDEWDHLNKYKVTLYDINSIHLDNIDNVQLFNSPRRQRLSP